MTTDQRERLFKASRGALLQSYSPYSNFKVSALSTDLPKLVPKKYLLVVI